MAPGPNKTIEDGIPVKQVNDKKYYWCPHHNDEKGKWVIRHPNVCENAHPPEEATPNANVAAFNTFEEAITSPDE